MRQTRVIAVAVAMILAIGNTVVLRAAEAPAPPDESAGRTPPRLSYVDGQASFWRPGSQEWAAAQVNIALAPGDELYTGTPGNLELQIGSRAFARAWGGTSLGLVNQEPDFLQFKVTAGHVSLDLRALQPGQTVELDTPAAAFTIEHAGYYRVDVSAERTSFVTRRGGRATVTPSNGQAVAIAPGEEVVIEGSGAPRLATNVAPQLDEWDRWNYARSNELIESVSARYVSPGMYGVSDLDRYGSWRVAPTYGPVWVPTKVAAEWVPYSTGAWTSDPYYGWTWVDTAPWGWAPYHYGRWVFLDSVWAWAPGPVVVRPVYAPALVAFFGAGPGVRVRLGGPVVGWVALCWGEPLLPWWGPAKFVGVPWWAGWSGPRVVNNVVINRTTVVNVQNITVYRNTSVQNSVVVVNHQQFGHGPIGSARLTHVDVRGLEPVRGRLEVKPVPASLAPTTARGVRPPEEHLARPVVATREPHFSSGAVSDEARRAPGVAPAPRLVPAPERAAVAPRPPSGQGRSERPQPPQPPRSEGTRHDGREVAAPSNARQAREPVSAESRAVGGVQSVPQAPAPRGQVPPPQPAHSEGIRSRRPEAAPPMTPQGTGPANRESRGVGAAPSVPQAPAPRVQAPPPQPAHSESVRSRRPEAAPPMTPQGPGPGRREAPALDAQPTPPPPAATRERRVGAQPAASQSPTARVEAPHPQSRPFTAESANRLSPGRAEARPSRAEAKAPRLESEVPKSPRGAAESPPHARNQRGAD